MPIRFRCAYCNQLMGIAKRKAGTIVRCPKCSGQVVVPDPSEGDADDDAGMEGTAQVDVAPVDADMAAAEANKVLEDAELDRLLAAAAPAPAPTQSVSSTVPTRAKSTRPKPAPAPAPMEAPPPIMEIDVEPVELPPPPPPVQIQVPAPLPKGAMVVKKAVAIGVVVVLVLLAVLTFVVGYLLGKRSSAEPVESTAIVKSIRDC